MSHSSLPSIASTAYDTAWVARLPSPQDSAQPRWSQTWHTLLSFQHEDGSWGSTAWYVSDRLVCTLAAINTLSLYSHLPHAEDALQKAVRWIWRHGGACLNDHEPLVGIELILPSLLQACTHTLPVYAWHYAAEQQQKRALFAADDIYRPQVTLAHSIEFLGSDVDTIRLRATQYPNGSLGNSPAATAFFAQYHPNDDALAYLSSCMDEQGSVPVLYPCTLFDTLWSAYYRALACPSSIPVLSSQTARWLQELLDRGQGISLDPSFPVPDADDTAVAIWLLRRSGMRVRDVALAAFEQDGTYRSFPYERHHSTGVNMHVLQALAYTNDPTQVAGIWRLLETLGSMRQHDTYWSDKWHVSPYYATCHAIVVCSQLPAMYDILAKPMLLQATLWLRQTQRSDGGWGYLGESTQEETAYAILGLAYSGQDVQHEMQQALPILLQEHYVHPALWIDKCLYLPHGIVRSAINSALYVMRRLLARCV